MKKALSILLIAVLLLSLAGCAPKEKTVVKVAIPAGVPVLSVIQLMEEQPEIHEDYTVEYEILATTDILVSKLLGGEVDMAIAPTNLGAKLYNKGAEYKLGAVNIWGNLYLATSEDISTWDELKGKEIYTIGQGLTPDLLMRYLMTENGLDPDEDVTFNYLGGGTELAPMFISGKSTVSLLPEPMLSAVKMKKEDTKVLFDFQKEFGTATGLGTSYPQAGLLVSNTLAENDKAFLDSFLDTLSGAAAWANENPADAGQYAENQETGLAKGIVIKSLPGSNIDFKDISESTESLEAYFQVLFDASADSIGGAIPDEGFYYQR